MLETPTPIIRMLGTRRTGRQAGRCRDEQRKGRQYQGGDLKREGYFARTSPLPNLASCAIASPSTFLHWLAGHSHTAGTGNFTFVSVKIGDLTGNVHNATLLRPYGLHFSMQQSTPYSTMDAAVGNCLNTHGPWPMGVETTHDGNAGSG